MSHLISRILLSMLMVPAAALIYLLLFLVIEDQVRADDGFLIVVTGLMTWVFVAAYWIWIWRKSVLWTTTRRAGTGVAGIIAAVVAIVFAAPGGLVDEDFVAFLWSAMSIILWLIFTVLLWRDTPRERAERYSGGGAKKTRVAILCPNCSYSMNGLREARCPECGSEFTIDELIARQSGADAGELG